MMPRFFSRIEKMEPKIEFHLLSGFGGEDDNELFPAHQHQTRLAAELKNLEEKKGIPRLSICDLLYVPSRFSMK